MISSAVTPKSRNAEVGNDGFEYAFGRKRADMEFVENQIFSRHSGPALIRPTELIGTEDCGWLIDTVRLPARGGVRAIRASI
jgi:hypothetical protein